MIEKNCGIQKKKKKHGCIILSWVLKFVFFDCEFLRIIDVWFLNFHDVT